MPRMNLFVSSVCVSLVVSVGIVALLWLWFWLAIWVIEQGMRTVNAYRYFCEFVWHREEFLKWRKERSQSAKC